ncbi:MAG: AAA family ATPase [Candidatus Rokubacteria bacterium]|nr:AAA family ATPase [Candidatus Rokubacteria bacterium]
MYEAYWGLSEPPFDNSPNPKFFYLSPEHEEALVRLMYAVRQRKGCAMLTGEYGCGKTTLSRALVQRLEADRFEIGLLTNPSWTAIDFLREILYQLGVETVEKNKSELLHLLNDLFFRNFQAGRDTVIIVDEAQLIDDDAVFEELRLLMNFQTDDRFLVTILLIGSPELAVKVRRLKHLDQRIAIRYHLNTLDDAHTANYVAHRLKMAGRGTQIFTEEAIKLIFDFTRGTPREINNLCDIALLVGYSKRLTEIDERVIAEVIKDMVGVS